MIRDEQQLINTIYTCAAELCHKALPADHRAFLKERYGFTDNFINKNKIGFGVQDLFESLQSKYGFNDEELLKSGFFLKTQNGIVNHFHARILFWYWSDGMPVYLIGRASKYVDHLYIRPLTYDEQSRPYISKMVQNKYLYNEDVCSTPDLKYVVVTNGGITNAMVLENLGIPAITAVTMSYREQQFDRLAYLTKNIDVFEIICRHESIAVADYLMARKRKCYVCELTCDDLSEFVKGKTKREIEEFLLESKLYNEEEF